MRVLRLLVSTVVFVPTQQMAVTHVNVLRIGWDLYAIFVSSVKSFGPVPPGAFTKSPSVILYIRFIWIVTKHYT